MIQSALGNAGTLQASEVTPENEFAFNIWHTFEELQNDASASRHTLGGEVMVVLQNYEEEHYLYYVEDEDEDEDEDMDEDTEDEDDDSVIQDITPTIIPLARTEENIAPDESTNKTEWRVRVPCAYELLYGSDRASCESRAVRDLVSLVENAMSDPTLQGEGWVKVSLDTTLSVGDLVTLQQMGYVCDGEWLGVNPTIYSGY